MNDSGSVAASRRTLLLTLGSMGLSSVATGLALAASRRTERDRGIARQFVAWGAINVAIAGIGGWREQARSAGDEAQERRKLRRTLLVNSGLDIGYIASGLAVFASADRLASRSDRYPAEAARGDGVGIVVQGAMLLALDTVFAIRLREDRFEQGAVDS